MNRLLISTITPVYMGADYLSDLAARLHSLRESWRQKQAPFELAEAIFVDDSAIDNSAAILDDLAGEYDFIRVIHLSRNFGQHPATIAGVLHSSGDWLVSLDEDLQHPPEVIADMLQLAAESGRDVVYANPTAGVHGSLFRDLSSRLYKKFIALLTRNPHVKHFNSFRLMRGPIARAAANVCGHETYFDIALSWFTNRVAALKADLRDIRLQQTGKSGYNFFRLLSHARRMVTSSQMKLLRLGALIGMTALIFSFAGAIFIIVHKLTDSTFAMESRGWASLIVTVLFFGGLSAFMLGILLEYTAVILLHNQGKPVFFTVDRSSDERLREFFRAQKSGTP